MRVFDIVILFPFMTKALYSRKMNVKVALNRHLNMLFIVSIRKNLFSLIHNLSMILSMCRVTIHLELLRKSADNWRLEFILTA